MLKLFPNISIMLEQIHIFKTGIIAMCVCVCVRTHTCMCVIENEVLITDLGQQNKENKENDKPPDFSAKICWSLSLYLCHGNVSCFK